MQTGIKKLVETVHYNTLSHSEQTDIEDLFLFYLKTDKMKVVCLTQGCPVLKISPRIITMTGLECEHS